MKTQTKSTFALSLCLLVAFMVWTAAVRVIDIQAIGPRDSAVGFASINQFVHNLTGVHFTLYNITDWLGLVPVAVCVGFAILGLMQWMSRKRIDRVDRDILALGGLYVLTIGAYLLFESVVINYRPVLINDFWEVSYPSSTTLLVLCVMPSSAMQFQNRLQNRVLRRIVVTAIVAFTAFMVIGRLISGVHWITDIVGGVLLSGALVTLYAAVCSMKTISSKRTYPPYETQTI